MKLGENLTLLNDSRYNRAGINHAVQLVCVRGAALTIGKNVGISGGAIFCTTAVTIGDNVLLGVNCSVFDTDFHAMDYRDRRLGRPGKSSPVIIEDDVWLGANVTVLKGVTIGARSVVGAGSVVTTSIPADTFAAGAPARGIRSLAASKAA
ncbi:MAG: acyltransferase [Planctomycetaceae bacterium]